MKVLWLCNIMLPVIAEKLGLEANNKEGWLSGLVSTLTERQQDNDISLAVAFPTSRELDGCRGETDSLQYYGFYEDTTTPECYDAELEERLQKILDDFKPDVIHCFGTEYPHTLAMAKIAEGSDRILIGIQGLCALYAEDYMAALPLSVQKKKTFRDILRKDSLREQQQKFVQRGEHEKEAVRRVKHVTGRTAWDKNAVFNWNPDVNYYCMNETLRADFYDGGWNAETCEKHSIFVSQGDYPIKGLHHALEAMPQILDKYPDAALYVGGNAIVRERTLKGRIRLSTYGKYVQELIDDLKLQDKVHFMGRLNATQMKDAYLQCGLFLCPSAIENSPNSLGEAMLLGMPVVTANVGGIPSLFVDEVDGILYESKGGAKALADAVIRMWDDEERMLVYGKNAAEHAQKTHNKKNNYQRLIEIYREISGMQAE